LRRFDDRRRGVHECFEEPGLSKNLLVHVDNSRGPLDPATRLTPSTPLEEDAGIRVGAAMNDHELWTFQDAYVL
jgi:hypothetical protein